MRGLDLAAAKTLKETTIVTEDRDVRLRFENSVIQHPRNLGVDTSTFESRGPDGYHGLHGGMPSDWRSNVYCAHEALDTYDGKYRRWRWRGPTYEVRETLCAQINAMKRDGYASFNDIMVRATDRLNVRPECDD